MHGDTVLETRGGKDIDARISEHFELIHRFLGQFGALAESLLAYHDLGIDKETIRGHIQRADAEVKRMQALGDRALEELPAAVLRPEVMAAWNSKKNLRYATGAILLTERFRDAMTSENRIRSFRAKLLYESILDTLDDLIDSGSYSFGDALDLMRHCVAPITAATFDPIMFGEELRARLVPEQRHLCEFLTAVVGGMQRLLRSSLHGADLAGAMERFHENWLFGQAYTMYQKDPTVDVRAFLSAAEGFPGPDSDLTGVERLSGWISHTAAITLVDLCFARELPSPGAMEEHMTAWFYFDAVVTLISNVADLPKDLTDGIANIFLISKGGDAVRALSRVRGFRPSLSMGDYESFFARAAEFSRRALAHAAASYDDPDGFYPFIALMVPVVMLTNETGAWEELLHAYLRPLARVMGSKPDPPIAATIPRRTRSGRTRSARTASS